MPKKKIVKKAKKEVSEMEALVEKIMNEFGNFKNHAEDFIDGDVDSGLKARQSSNTLTVMFKEFRKLSVQK